MKHFNNSVVRHENKAFMMSRLASLVVSLQAPVPGDLGKAGCAKCANLPCFPGWWLLATAGSEGQWGRNGRWDQARPVAYIPNFAVSFTREWPDTLDCSAVLLLAELHVVGKNTLFNCIFYRFRVWCEQRLRVRGRCLNARGGHYDHRSTIIVTLL